MIDPLVIEEPVEAMFFDTDCAKVIHNLAYLRFIETARTRLAEALGWSLRRMEEDGIFPVLIRTEIDYHGTGRLGDRLVVRGGLEEASRVRFWFRFRVERPADGALLVSSRQQLALVRFPAEKVLPVPREWRDRAHPDLFGSESGRAG